MIQNTPLPVSLLVDSLEIIQTMDMVLPEAALVPIYPASSTRIQRLRLQHLP